MGQDQNRAQHDVDRALLLGQVVREGLAAAAKGKPVVVPSRKYAALVTLLRYLPRGTVRTVSAALAARRRRDSDRAELAKH